MIEGTLEERDERERMEWPMNTGFAVEGRWSHRSRARYLSEGRTVKVNDSLGPQEGFRVSATVLV